MVLGTVKMKPVTVNKIPVTVKEVPVSVKRMSVTAKKMPVTHKNVAIAVKKGPGTFREVAIVVKKVSHLCGVGIILDSKTHFWGIIELLIELLWHLTVTLELGKLLLLLRNLRALGLNVEGLHQLLGHRI